MEQFSQLFDTYGYSALVVLGAAEFLGAPIAAAPVLLVVGAASVGGMVNPWFAVGAIVAGALAGESVWFGLARWRGKRLVDMACGLASNPNLCVFSFGKRLQGKGASLLVLSKFVPGSGSLPAFAAGLSGFRFRRFLVADAVALVLWSATYILVGSAFHSEVDELVAMVSAHVATAAAVLGGIIGVAAAWRLFKARRHRALHVEHAAEIAASGILPPAVETPIIAPCRASTAMGAP